MVSPLSLSYVTAFHRCEACPSKQTCRDWLDRHASVSGDRPELLSESLHILFEMQVDQPICNPTRSNIELENIIKNPRLYW